MHTYVAFLRGINLGRRRVRNEELCACFEALGFESVSAFLASGNVIFSCSSVDPDAVRETLQGGLKASLGYDVQVFLRSAAQVIALAAHEPFDAAALARSNGKLQVALLEGAPSADAAKAALTLATPEDQLALHEDALYWLPKGGVSDSALKWRGVESAVGSTTVRTHGTLARLAAKMPG